MFGWFKEKKVEPKVMIVNMPANVVPIADGWFMDLHLVNDDQPDNLTTASHVVVVLYNKELESFAKCSMPIGQARTSGFRLNINKMFQTALGLHDEKEDDSANASK